MKTTGKLTQQQIDSIKELVSKGYMDSEIAKYFGNVTASCICYWRKKLNIKSTFTYEKVSKVSHAKLIELSNKGLSDYKVAKELGIKPCTVFSYRKMHGINTDRNLKYNPAIKLTSFQRQVLIGTVMGDGSLRKTNTNPYFSCAHGKEQKEYCEYKYEILKNLGATIKYHKRNVVDKRTGLYYEDYTVRLSCNPELLPLYNAFYNNGKKVLPITLLDDYTEVSMAFHYMDDGYKMKDGYAFATNCFSIEDLKVFKKMLEDKFGLKTSIWKSCNGIYIWKSSTDLFKSLVKPYVIESMQYKL